MCTLKKIGIGMGDKIGIIWIFNNKMSKGGTTLRIKIL